jgi:hypothetical protein
MRICNTRIMKKVLSILFLTFISLTAVVASTANGEELIKKATAIVDESAQKQYSKTEGEKKISCGSVLPKADDKNVVITFTIDENNKIHIVEVLGGYAYINHYIKTSLEGKAIKSENAIPGINYVMTVKLPTSV